MIHPELHWYANMRIFIRDHQPFTEIGQIQTKSYVTLKMYQSGKSLIEVCDRKSTSTERNN